MNPEIEKRFDALEARRVALIERVRQLPAEQQKQKPANGGFSPSDVIQHFVLAEGSNLNFLKKASPSSLKGRTPKVTFIFRSTLKSLQSASKALPGPGGFMPKTHVDVETSAKAWAEIRSQYRAYLEQAENMHSPFIKFLFFFGLPSVEQWFEFYEAHMHYHETRFPA